MRTNKQKILTSVPQNGDKRSGNRETALFLRCAHTGEAVRPGQEKCRN